MRKYIYDLNFIPKSVPFSSLEPWQVEEASGFTDEPTLVEERILQMVASLESDKERCVFFYQILREYGFQFNYAACARSLKVNWRWYMRVKERVKKKLISDLS